jgi:hypothetical protein
MSSHMSIQSDLARQDSLGLFCGPDSLSSMPVGTLESPVASGQKLIPIYSLGLFYKKLHSGEL